METTVSNESNRTPKKRVAKTAKAKSSSTGRTKKARSAKSVHETPPSISELLQSMVNDRSRGEKLTALAGALGLAAIAASRRGRKLLGRTGSFVFPIAVSIVQPRVEAFVRSAIEKKLNRTDA